MKSMICGLTFSMILIAVTAPAMAKDPTDGKSADIASQKVICNRTFIEPDVKPAEYQAGVDVYGNSVMTATINDKSDMVPEYIEMPLTVDFAAKLNMNAPQGMEFKGNIANLKLYKNGKIEYNGQDITKIAATACGIVPSSYSSRQPANYNAPPVMSEPPPASGSVAASSTGPVPTPVYEVRRGTQNQ